MLKSIIDFFNDDDITIYAAGLSFFTLFSSIPLLIFVFTIFANMPMFYEIYAEFKVSIFTFLLPQKSEPILDFLDQFVVSTVEVEYIYLAYMAVISVMFFRYHEHVVSRICESSDKPLYILVLSLIALILLIPILFIYLLVIAQYLQWQYATFFVSWGLFFVIYYVATPSYYKLLHLAIGSALASLAWYVSKNLYLYYVLLNTTYPTLYGSFSTLFFSLFWVYLSWMIYLYGLKLTRKLNGTHHTL